VKQKLPPTRRPNQTGFTLVELMITVALIAILAAVALPSYQNYKDRARFAEAVIALSSYRSSIIIAAESGRFNSMKDIKEGKNGVPKKQKRTVTTHGIKVKNGVITVEWKKDGTDLEKTTFTLTADSFTAPINWQTGGSCVAAGYC